MNFEQVNASWGVSYSDKLPCLLTETIKGNDTPPLINKEFRKAIYTRGRRQFFRKSRGRKLASIQEKKNKRKSLRRKSIKNCLIKITEKSITFIKYCKSP